LKLLKTAFKNNPLKRKETQFSLRIMVFFKFHAVKQREPADIKINSFFEKDTSRQDIVESIKQAVNSCS